MLAIRIAFARLRALFRRDATTDEIREELQFHVAMRADEYTRNGLDADAARRAALQRFGNLAVIQDRGYDVRGGGLMETIRPGRQVRDPATGPAARFCDPGRPDTGAGHRGLDRALQRHRRRAIAAPPVPASRGARYHRGGRIDRWQQAHRLCAVDGRHPDVAGAEDDSLACRDGARQRQRTGRGYRHAAASDRGQSLRRLPRDLRHHAGSGSKHSGGRHARRRAGRRTARPRLLAAGIRRRSKRAWPGPAHPERARDHRRRATGGLLPGDGGLAGRTVHGRLPGDARFRHAGDRAAATGCHADSGPGSSHGRGGTRPDRVTNSPARYAW